MEKIVKLNGKLVSSGNCLEIDMTERATVSIRETEVVTDDLCIAPALVDIQVNGFAGYDFNAENVTPNDVSGMIQALWRVGTGFLCPTVITGAFERMAGSLRAIVAACNDSKINQSIVGIHVEGPYISPEDGPRGAHPKAHVRKPDWDEFQRWQEVADGKICMVTLAPEIEGAIPFIEKLTAQGIITALGHTNAAQSDIDAAIKSGAQLSTHLGNGAHALIRRHPNYIWEQLAADELWASLIVDGHHLPPSVVKCMMRAKGLSRCVLVSDAVSLAGMPPGRYQFADREVELTSERCVRLVDTEYLAGSAIELARGVENSVRFAQIPLEDAIALATNRPAELLGITDRLTVDDGQNANLILFRWDELTYQIDLIGTILNREVVYLKAHSDEPIS
jgi:N-acetylglucosamine-6-phosphate deacetylase